MAPLNSSKQTKTFSLTIVRHGQTIANLKKIIQGHCDTPLTELGLQQAKSLSSYFAKRVLFSKVYSSDLNRALDTCKIIVNFQQNKQMHDKQNLIVADVRLRERSYGSKLEGQLISSLQQEAYKFGFNELNFTQYSPIGVESMSDVIARIESFCNDTLFEQTVDGDQVLIVTHWATIKEFFKIFQPFAAGSIKQEHLRETPNVAFNTFSLTISKNNQDKMFRIDKVNVLCLHQTPHLNEHENSVNITHQME